MLCSNSFSKKKIKQFSLIYSVTCNPVSWEQNHINKQTTIKCLLSSEIFFTESFQRLVCYYAGPGSIFGFSLLEPWPVVSSGFTLTRCTVDPTVQIHSSSNHRQFRFSMEAFKFIGLHDQVRAELVSTRLNSDSAHCGQTLPQLEPVDSVLSSKSINKRRKINF